MKKASKPINMQELEQQLDQLGGLPKSEAPAFLLTRIRSRIKENPAIVRPAIAWSAMAAVMILLAVNVLVLRSQQRSDAEQIMQGMHLNSQNALYP